MNRSIGGRSILSMDFLFDAFLEVFDRSIKIMGPFLLVGGSFLVCVVGSTFFMTPFISIEEHSLPTVVILDSVGAFLWFNILFNWFMCFKTDPGSPPREAPRSDIQNAICQKCDSFKPPRAHHCHVCQRCILAMDHHCPWMANCIGFYNYRYFVLTLLYLEIGCVFCAVISAVEFEILQKLFYGMGSMEISKQIFFVFFLTTCVGVAVGLLLSWHIYLILSGQTTIEFYQRRSTPASRRRSFVNRSWFKMSFFQQPLETNDYDLGPGQNWERVFGQSSIPFVGWAMPSMEPPQGDGIEWKSCRSLVSSLV